MWRAETQISQSSPSIAPLVDVKIDNVTVPKFLPLSSKICNVESGNPALASIAFDSSIGRAEDCNVPFDIPGSLVRIRLERVFYNIDMEPDHGGRV